MSRKQKLSAKAAKAKAVRDKKIAMTDRRRKMKAENQRKRRARSKLPAQYNAPPGSARERAIKQAAKLYKSGKKQQAFRLRERMERRERAKKKKR
jgi:hypothetical protein